MAKVISKSISHVSYHTKLDWRRYPYVRLFVFLYTGWLYCYIQKILLKHDEFFFLALGSIATINALTVLSCFWSVKAKVFLTCKTEPNYNTAELVKVVPTAHKGSPALCPIVRHKLLERGDGGAGKKDVTITHTWFEFQKKKFILDEDKNVFHKVPLPLNKSFSEYQKNDGILDENQEASARDLYGLNQLEIPIPSFKELFKEHAVAPFFVFQVFCVLLWCLDEYWMYSLFTLFMLIVFESTVVFQRLRTLKEFRTMSNSPFEVYVQRGKGNWKKTTTDKLLPGDVCFVSTEKGENGEIVVPCDLLLLDGSCIVNEAILSGESTPLVKENITERKPSEVFNFDASDKKHIIYGGTRIIQCSSGSSYESPSGSPGCLTFVLRTGFRTSQGKLVRTIVYSSERVSANNLESFIFILFLLIFAIAAAAYVWVKGLESEAKSRSKLMLECILIITAVVPPELPMELSMAVNSSLMALSKLAIFCTEPFRIPLGGKIDVCCFDKTGTITDESLNLEGLVGISAKDPHKLISIKDAPVNTLLITGACHSLAVVNGKVVGDSMEKETFEAAGFQFNETNGLIESGKRVSIKIVKKFDFNSALKRMSCVAKVSVANGAQDKYLVASKGAPEVLADKFLNRPAWYTDVYKGYAREGSRVLALGSKVVSFSKEFDRGQVESGLEFAGFLVFHCPIKHDSKDAIEKLLFSSHRVIMITGDNPLTACHVAKQVSMVNDSILILDGNEKSGFAWSSIDEKVHIDASENTSFDIKTISDRDLCVTGSGLSHIQDAPFFKPLLPRISVFSRVSPSQKELIITSLKELGLITLMCGDGTNDVGALKQCHVGVALLDGKPEDLEKMANIQKKKALIKQKENMENAQKVMESYLRKLGYSEEKIRESVEQRKKDFDANFEKMLGNAGLGSDFLSEIDDQVPVIKLGDASVAAPFTSKISSIMSVVNIIRQGRCTLVTTLQMFKILALNCLITAYSLSVLYLDGIKYGDFQATISSMLIAVCFLFLSQSKPLTNLSKEKPLSNILNFYVFSSIILQFAVHVASLFYISTFAKKLMGEDFKVDLEGDFKPTLLNSAIYLLSLSMQVSTFAANYQGQPFREGLWDNRPMRNGLLAVFGIAFICATETFPDINEQLQIVPFPETFRDQLVTVMAIDFGACFVIEVITKYLFSHTKPKAILGIDRQFRNIKNLDSKKMD